MGTVSCPDTLEEERWPGFAAAALARGVRCCVTLAQRSGERALTLTMFGARPRSLDPDQLPLAELLVAFGGAVMGNAVAYDGVQRTVLRLRHSVESGSLLDQARGVLMNARGCTAEEAWQQMRAMSAAQHLTMTEVARAGHRVPGGERTGGRGGLSPSRPPGPAHRHRGVRR